MINYREKKTRNCLHPWQTVVFFADGRVLPCCGMTSDSDFGNFYENYFEKIAKNQEPDIFIDKAYRRLRSQLLTGELSDACKNCRVVAEDDITTKELRDKVNNYLAEKGSNSAHNSLEQSYSFSNCLASITNVCNFSCIYCTHSSSADESTSIFEIEMAEDIFIKILEYLVSKGLSELNFVGIGEFTIYEGWQDLCCKILNKFPGMKLSMVSNFGRRFTDSDVNMLSKFETIFISCDTIDPVVYSRLRRGGSLEILIDNVNKLLDSYSLLTKKPRLCLNIVESDIILLLRQLNTAIMQRRRHRDAQRTSSPWFYYSGGSAYACGPLIPTFWNCGHALPSVPALSGYC